MDDARASAPTTKGLGYDQPGPASMYRNRMESVFHTDYPVLFWLKSLIRPNIRIFDLGGHVGVSFYAYEKYIDYPDGLIWHVCDVPAVTASGMLMAKSKLEDRLLFTNEYGHMDGSNILLASGSLQYIEQDLSEMLTGLHAAPEHLLINLLPAHKDRACTTLQNIGTAFCAYRTFKTDTFIRSICKAGYELKDQWENPDKACDIPFHEEYSVKPYSGFYFTQKTLPGSDKHTV